jgi:hypothetical protein
VWRGTKQFEIEQIKLRSFASGSPVSMQINGLRRTPMDIYGLSLAVSETAACEKRCAFWRRTALLSGGGGI